MKRLHAGKENTVEARFCGKLADLGIKKHKLVLGFSKNCPLNRDFPLCRSKLLGAKIFKNMCILGHPKLGVADFRFLFVPL